MKYELTEETKETNGRTLRRVRYLDSGELGGWLKRHETPMCGEWEQEGQQ